MRRGAWILLSHDFMIEVGIHFLLLLILDFFRVFVYCWLVVPERVIAARVYIYGLVLLGKILSRRSSTWLLFLSAPLKILSLVRVIARSVRWGSLMSVVPLVTVRIISKIVSRCITLLLFLVITSRKIFRYLSSAVILLIALSGRLLFSIIIRSLIQIVHRLLSVGLSLCSLDWLCSSTGCSHSRRRLYLLRCQWGVLLVRWIHQLTSLLGSSIHHLLHTIILPHRVRILVDITQVFGSITHEVGPRAEITDSIGLQLLYPR